MARRTLTAFALVALGWGIVVRPTAQTVRGPLASVEVLRAPIVTLGVPTTDYEAFDAARRLLESADVPFGLEGPALPAGATPIDFAQPLDRTLVLTGLTVGAALDAIAAADSRFRWSETGGVIVGRLATDVQGLLDRKVPRFVVADANPRDVIDRLMMALDPGRASGFGITGMGRPAGGRVGEPVTRKGKNVSLALENETVLSILNAIARTNGALSWVVSYDHAPASYETATVTFTESAVTVTAQAPAVFRAAAGRSQGPLGPAGLIPVVSDITGMLNFYSRLSHVAIGVEQLPTALPNRYARGVPALDVSALTPAEAIARIAAFDSRYDVSRSNGVFHVKPKADLPDRDAILDRPVDSFVATREPLETVLNRLLDLAGVQHANFSHSLVGSLASASVEAGDAFDAFRNQPVSFTLPKRAALRDVMDAACREAKISSWMLQHRIGPNGQSNFILLLQKEDGSGLSRTFNVAAPVPSRPRTIVSPAFVPAPGEPGRPRAAGPRITVALPVTIVELTRAVERLVAGTRTPIGLETVSPVSAGGPSGFPPPGSQYVELTGLTIADALDKLTGLLPDYTWSQDGPIFHIRPRVLQQARNVPLDRRVDAFDRKFSNILSALENVAAIFDEPRSNPTLMTTSRMGGPQREFSVTLANATVREIFDAIVLRHGEMAWHVDYTDANGTYPEMQWSFIGFDGGSQSRGVMVTTLPIKTPAR